MSCPYAYFGLLPTAHPDVVKLAIRLAMLRDHPDKGGSPDALTRTRMARKAIEAGGVLPPDSRVAEGLGTSLGAAFSAFRGKRRK